MSNTQNLWRKKNQHEKWPRFVASEWMIEREFVMKREEKIVEGDNFFFHFFFKSKEREETSGVSKSIWNRKWSTGVAKLEQQSQRGEANEEKSECVKKHRKKKTQQQCQWPSAGKSDTTELPHFCDCDATTAALYFCIGSFAKLYNRLVGVISRKEGLSAFIFSKFILTCKFYV